MLSFYEKLAAISRDNRRAALCTLISTQGSTPRKAGTKMIVLEDGSLVGTIGGGQFEKRVIEESMGVIQQNKPVIFHFDLREDLEMTCGGKASVFIEPVHTTHTLYIFGGGHVGKAVAKLASDFGFTVTILDERPEIAEEPPVPFCRYIIGDFQTTLANLTFDDRTFAVITTSKHMTDEAVLTACLRKPFAYLGMIGSRSKVEEFRRKLTEAGFSNDELNRVNMPIGLPFRAETPQEIAISILAKLIDFKNSASHDRSS
ncbi:MAG: XdhC family protein [Bacteroidetes bacterium]|nr:XdhC family protein [Bacteroidota bacterium]